MWGNGSRPGDGGQSNCLCCLVRVRTCSVSQAPSRRRVAVARRHCCRCRSLPALSSGSDPGGHAFLLILTPAPVLRASMLSRRRLPDEGGASSAAKGARPQSPLSYRSHLPSWQRPRPTQLTPARVLPRGPLGRASGLLDVSLWSVPPTEAGKWGRAQESGFRGAPALRAMSGLFEVPAEN